MHRAPLTSFKGLALAVSLAIRLAVRHIRGTLVVTPEPATIGLVATGVGVLGLAAWIRGRRK